MTANDDLFFPSSSKPPPGGLLIPVGNNVWSEEKVYLLTRSKTTIGRSSECSVRINQPSVSRLHAELAWADGTLLISHLSPSSPTFVNGVPVAEPRPLASGDVIEIGHGIALRLELFPDGEDAATVPMRWDLRRIYAVVHADVAGYSRLVEDDDIATARDLERRVDIIRESAARAEGRVEVQGDSVLTLYVSALLAVNSSLAWQRAIAALNEAAPPSRQMAFRVGVNTGDVLVTPSGKAYGDAINIAARIQAIAAPGAVFVSGIVKDQLAGRDELQFDYIGTESLKNISHQVRVYRVGLTGRPAISGS